MKKSALIVGISVPKSNFGVKIVSEIIYSIFYHDGKKFCKTLQLFEL